MRSDTKVTDAVNRQAELLMQSSRDYQAAVMSGRIDQSGRSAISPYAGAEPSMKSTWRDE
ncbi:MAG: hypothetical protein ACLTCP_13640 [Ruminococcus bicirculans (ex Wegman et al. 2014)]